MQNAKRSEKIMQSFHHFVHKDCDARVQGMSFELSLHKKFLNLSKSVDGIW